MGKPFALALTGLLLALPLACGDDDDTGGATGGKAGTGGKGGTGGVTTGGTVGNTGGTAGGKGGSGGSTGGTGAKGGSGGTAVTGGAGGVDGGAGQGGAVPPDAGAGGVAGGAGGEPGTSGGGAGGSLGGQGGEAGSGEGGSGGATDVGAQFAAAAASICAAADPLNCTNEAACQTFWQEGYGVPGCAPAYRDYIVCVDALAAANLACDNGNAGPDYTTAPGLGCSDEAEAHGLCLVTNQ